MSVRSRGRPAATPAAIPPPPQFKPPPLPEEDDGVFIRPITRVRSPVLPPQPTLGSLSPLLEVDTPDTSRSVSPSAMSLSSLSTQSAAASPRNLSPSPFFISHDSFISGGGGGPPVKLAKSSKKATTISPPDEAKVTDSAMAQSQPASQQLLLQEQELAKTSPSPAAMEAEQASFGIPKTSAKPVEEVTAKAPTAVESQQSQQSELAMDESSSPKVSKRSINDSLKHVEEPVPKAFKAETEESKMAEKPVSQFKRRQSKKIVPRKFDTEKGNDRSEGLALRKPEEPLIVPEPVAIIVEPSVPSRLGLNKTEPEIPKVAEEETKEKPAKRKIKVKKVSSTKQADLHDTINGSSDNETKKGFVHVPNKPEEALVSSTSNNVVQDTHEAVESEAVLDRKDLTDKERLVITEVIRTRKPSTERGPSPLGSAKAGEGASIKAEAMEICSDSNTAAKDEPRVQSNTTMLSNSKKPEINDKSANTVLRKTDEREIGSVDAQKSEVKMSKTVVKAKADARLSGPDCQGTPDDQKSEVKMRKNVVKAEAEARLSGSFEEMLPEIVAPDINIADLTVEHLLEALGATNESPEASSPPSTNITTSTASKSQEVTTPTTAREAKTRRLSPAEITVRASETASVKVQTTSDALADREERPVTNTSKSHQKGHNQASIKMAESSAASAPADVQSRPRPENPKIQVDLIPDDPVYDELAHPVSEEMSHKSEVRGKSPLAKKAQDIKEVSEKKEREEISNVQNISGQDQSINEQNKNTPTSDKTGQNSAKKLPKTPKPTLNTFSATSTGAMSQKDEVPVTTQLSNSALTAKQQLNAGQVTGQNKINPTSNEMEKPQQKLSKEQVTARIEPKEHEIARSSPKDPNMARKAPKEQGIVRREQPKEPEVVRRAPKESENKRSPPKDPETARREAREQEILRRAPPAKRSVQTNQGSSETLSPAAGLETRNFRNQAENYAKEKPSAATKNKSGGMVSGMLAALTISAFIYFIYLQLQARMVADQGEKKDEYSYFHILRWP